ncbi:hypothetical protein C8024_11180 [Sphingopyxis sp. BSNA05]|nr:hypothetical protein [Sphingopyxis sp. BSNA05]
MTARLLKSAVAAGALLSLGGCMYGGGAYGDGYVNGRGYDCDPYAPFDDYYACDYGYGFANIGYGGGWYDQYYYPGYGIYIFDRGGRRLAMRDNHRRYWARQRAAYGGHRARDRRDRDGRADRRGDRRDSGYDGRDRTRDPDRNSSRRQRDSDDRDNRGTRNDRRNRTGTSGTRAGGTDQAAPSRDRGDRGSRTDRRPASGAEQPQARPQPAPRADSPPRSTRADPIRNSRETSRRGRKPLSDD